MLILVYSISGFILGITREDKNYGISKNQSKFIVIGISMALAINIPAIQREHLILVANQRASTELLVNALEKFPKSTTGYNRTLLLFDENNLPKESLVVAKNALKFNKRTYTAYVVIITSLYTSREEKIEAYKMLQHIDPNNPKLSPISPFRS